MKLSVLGVALAMGLALFAPPAPAATGLEGKTCVGTFDTGFADHTANAGMNKGALVIKWRGQGAQLYAQQYIGNNATYDRGAQQRAGIVAVGTDSTAGLTYRGEFAAVAAGNSVNFSNDNQARFILNFDGSGLNGQLDPRAGPGRANWSVATVMTRCF